MKKILKLAYILCCASLFLLTACHDDPDPVKKASRTVLAYIAADNSLGDYELGDLDIAEMVEGYAAVEADSSNLLVYVDDRSTPRLIQITKASNGAVVKKIIHEYAEQNSLDVSVMYEVFKRVFDSFPANSYGLVLWSHGEGWIPANPAAPSTRWFGEDKGTYMNISALKTVLETAPHFDFILSDACFMQSIEVAYELRAYADYFISSPTEIPGPGAYYVDVVPAMFKEASTKKEEAINVASGYYNYYADKFNGGKASDDGKGGTIPFSNDNWTAGVSISVIESDKLEALAAATKNILPRYISGGSSVDTSGFLCYDRRNSTKFYYDLNELIQALTATSSDTGYTMWRATFDAAVPLFLTTDKVYSDFESSNNGMFSMKNANGVSTYIPRNGSYYYLGHSYTYSTLNKYYQTFQWYTDAGWSGTGW